jgi:chromosomal replication initiator protein
MTGEKRDKDIIELLAHAITDNIREIEWALNVFISKKTLLKRDLSKEDIEQWLKTLWYKHHIIQQEWPSHTINTKTQHNFHQTIENIAHYFSVSSKEILWDSRKKDISQIRQLSMYIAKKHFWWTLEKIGDFFGGKNHTTVIYAIEKCEKTLKTDTNFHHDYQTLCQHHQR